MFSKLGYLMLFVLGISIYYSEVASENIVLCQNGGTLHTNSSGNVECQCHVNSSGENCQIVFCENGGTPYTNSSGYVECQCDVNLSEENCQIVFCDGGTPYTNSSGYVECQCDVNFRDESCQKVYCENGATPSINSSGDIVCQCRENFTGEHCHLVYCENGESPSINSSGDVVCQCRENFTGEHCHLAECTYCDQKVYEHIFKDYVKHVRPALRPSNVTNVYAQFNILNLLDIIEKDEMMQVMGFFGLYWFDGRLAWNPSDFGGVESISIPADEVWCPDVILSNTGTTFYDPSYKRDYLVQITSAGGLIWEYGGIILTSCDINMANYPLDNQNCSIVIETWRYRKTELLLIPFHSKVKIYESAYENSMWNLTSTQTTASLAFEDQFSRLTFSFSWQRKPLYYYMNILVPAVMMVLICLGVFWLPSESGEKVSLAVTVLLAFSVFLIVIMDNTPASSSNTPILTIFVILVMSVTTLALLVAILISFLTGQTYGSRAPKWLRIICFKYVATLLCMKGSVHKDESLEIITKDGKKQPVKTGNLSKTTDELVKVMINDDNLQPVETANHSKPSDGMDKNTNNNTNDLSEQLQCILKFIDEQEASDAISKEWTLIGKVIDRFFFWFSLLVLVIVLPILFLKVIY